VPRSWKGNARQTTGEAINSACFMRCCCQAGNATLCMVTPVQLPAVMLLPLAMLNMRLIDLVEMCLIVHHKRCHNPPVTVPTGLAGDPATMVCGATGLSTKLPAAICAPSPMRILPSTVADAPMSTLSLILGWRSPWSLPVPPSVTFCRRIWREDMRKQEVIGRTTCCQIYAG
jgi:hypothetical protein